MNPVKCIVESPAGTHKLAATVAKLLSPPLVIGFNGPLGAGKTEFIRGLAVAWEIEPRAVVSPTFSLIQTYQGKHVIHHLDVYRLRNSDEFLDLGVDEMFAEPNAIALIEWSERVQDALPEELLEIDIQPLDLDRRLVTFQFTEESHGEIADQLAVAVSQFG